MDTKIQRQSCDIKKRHSIDGITFESNVFLKLTNMAIYRLDSDSNDLLRTEGYCDGRERVDKLSCLTPKLRECVSEFMQMLFSYGNGTFIPNPLGSSKGKPIPDDAARCILWEKLTQNYDYSSNKGKNNHVADFWASYPNEFYINAITGREQYTRMMTESGKLIAFKTKKGQEGLKKALPKFLMLDNAVLKSVILKDNRTLNDFEKPQALTFGNADVFFIDGLNDFTNQEIRLTAYHHDKQLCIVPESGIDEVNIPKIENKDLKWPNNDVNLEPFYKAIYALFIENKGSYDICNNEFTSKLLDKYKNMFDMQEESKRYNRLKSKVLSWTNIKEEVARKIDKMNDKIMRNPSNSLFALRKKNIEKHVSESNPYIIPYFYLTEKFGHL